MSRTFTKTQVSTPAVVVIQCTLAFSRLGSLWLRRSHHAASFTANLEGSAIATLDLVTLKVLLSSQALSHDQVIIVLSVFLVGIIFLRLF